MGELVSGANKRVMVGLEATPGTELPTPGAKAMEFLILSETIKGTEEQKDSMLLSSDGEPRDPAAGKIAAAGDIKTYIQSKSFGLFALWALGGYTAGGGAGPHYVHTFKPARTVRALDLDIEIPFSAGSRYKRVNNLVCNSFAFGFAASDFVEATFGCLASNVRKVSSAYSVTPTDMTDELSYRNRLLDGASLTLNGSAGYGKFVTLAGTWNWNRYTDDYRAGADGVRNSTPKKRATNKGTMRIGLEAEGDWDLALNGGTTPVDAEWKWVFDADTYVKMTLPRIWIARTDPDTADDNPEYLDLSWTAAKDPVAASSFIIEMGSTVKDYTNVSLT